MKASRLLMLSPALLLAAFLVVGCGGGGAKVQSSTTTTTMGQELTDLKKAYDDGTITESQYEKAKAKILKRYDN